MILAFFITLIISSAISFKTATQSMFVMIIYIVLVAIGTVFYYFVKIDLKRRKAEQEGHTVDIDKVVADADEGKKEGDDNTTGGQRS